MKKKFFNGILLVAALFVTSSAFVSCKDNDADEITNAKIEIQKDLQTQLAALQSRIDAIKQCNCDNTEILNRLKAAEDAIKALQDAEPDLSNYVTLAQLETALEGVATKEEVEAIVNQLEAKFDDYATQEELDAAVEGATKLITLLAEAITELENALLQQVTSVNIDAVANPVFGFVSAPIDLQSNMLIACYGKAASDVEFPVGSGEPLADAGDVLTLSEGNAGKLFVTINPSSVDFTGKVLTLESTSGNQAPVVLSPAKASEQEINFGWTRSGNAFYEVSAQIPAESLKDAAVSLTKQDLKNLKEDIKVILKNRTKSSAKGLVADLYELCTRNTFTAYRLKASWEYAGDTYSTFSESKIAALALIPLSYSFNPEGAISKEELKKIEEPVTNLFVEVGSGNDVELAINRFWSKFNTFVEKVLDNVNYALQPCLLIQEGTKMSLADNHSYSGEIQLIPTSRTAEVFAPAYKKYVKVTCDGEEIKGDLLGKVIDGTVLKIPFKVESGKTYEIEYQAVDFTGVTRVKNYTIYGK